MRNAIVFINICVVAAVTMIVMDFETTSSLPDLGAIGAPSQSPTSDSLSGTTTKAALATLEQVRSTRSRRPMSDAETAFVKEFITEMSHARMSSLTQAQMATQRGTTRSMKDYGAWMVINQERMITDLKKLARLHHVEMPDTKAVHSTEELSDLQELHGKKFDSRYIKTMTAGYKRDLKLLERAGYSTDPDVQVFAARYLSITQANFDKLKALR